VRGIKKIVRESCISHVRKVDDEATYLYIYMIIYIRAALAQEQTAHHR